MSDSIYDLNDQFRTALLNSERAAASQMVREYGKAWQVIQKRIEELAAQYYALAEAGGKPPISWIYEMDRLQVLQNQVEGEIRKFAQYTEGAIEKGQKKAIAAAQLNAVSLMDAGLPEGAHVKFNRLPKKAFENLVGFLQDGSPLKDLLNQLPGEAGKLVADGLQTGLLLGWNPTRTASHIREALGGNLARALRIARTETLRSYREATRQTYKANNHVVKGWEWRCARNERTCAMCWAMDGTEHSFEERLNDHFCGRCSMLPLMKSWQELGFNIDEVKDKQPKTGIEAFELLSHTEQMKILGPAKYAAYKDGAFKLSDLVGETTNSRWGSMRYEKSLKQILGEEKAKEYTRLALLGVARNAPGYSVDDLIRVAGVGLRELTPREVSRITEKIGEFGLCQELIQKVDHSIAGLIWKGKVLNSGDMISPLDAHYLKHVMVNCEWPKSTSVDQYIESLHEVIISPKSEVLISKYHDYWQISFVGESGKWHGENGFSHILVEYRVKYGYWVTGFQPEDLQKQLIMNRSDLKWIRKLSLK